MTSVTGTSSFTLTTIVGRIYKNNCREISRKRNAAEAIAPWEDYEELFLQESLSAESDTIMDFVDTWYPSGNDAGGSTNVEDSIQSDVQLGYMLDKILGV